MWAESFQFCGMELLNFENLVTGTVPVTTHFRWRVRLSIFTVTGMDLRLR